MKALSAEYRPHDGTAKGWDLTLRLQGDDSKKYLKLWRRQRNSIDELHFLIGRTRNIGHAKITRVVLVKNKDGSIKATEVTWNGLGTPETVASI